MYVRKWTISHSVRACVGGGHILSWLKKINEIMQYKCADLC